MCARRLEQVWWCADTSQKKKKAEVHRRPRGKAKRSFIDAVKEDLVLVGVRGCREEFERGG